MIYIVTLGERKFEIEIDGDSLAVKLNGRQVAIDHRFLRGGKLHSILADNAGFEFEIIRSNGGIDIWHGSGQLYAEVVDQKTDRLRQMMGSSAAGQTASSLKAPMPGLVVKVEVEAGQRVNKGDGLVIVEAMKMENELRAHAPGVIKEVRVEPGQAVEKNQVLIIFE
jgi:biotin carboxyl carrier protein